jgi:hypothetical protein
MCSFDAPATPVPGVDAPGYRLHLMAPDGATLGWEEIQAQSDETAIHEAKRRLERAAMVEVWSQGGWVCSLERRRPAARAGGGRT